MRMAAILVIWLGPFEQTLVPPSHRSTIWNLTDWLVSEVKTFKVCGWRQTTEAYLSYKLTNEPGSGELKTEYYLKLQIEFAVEHKKCPS